MTMNKLIISNQCCNIVKIEIGMKIKKWIIYMEVNTERGIAKGSLNGCIYNSKDEA